MSVHDIKGTQYMVHTWNAGAVAADNPLSVGTSGLDTHCAAPSVVSK